MARYSTTGTSIGGIDIADVTHAILRIGVGLLFLQHGLQKFGFLGGQSVPLDSLLGVAGILELAGSTLMILGLFTRPVAVVLTLEMLGAYFYAHYPRGGFPIQNGGEVALLFALAFFYFAGNGAGPFSLDAALRRSRTGTDALRHDTRRAA